MKAVFICSDANYQEDAAITFMSIIDNIMPDVIPYVFTLKSNPVDPNLFPTANVVELDWELDEIDNLSVIAETATTLRFRAMEFLRNEGYERAVYLDCDMIVQDNLQPLFDMQMDNFAFAMARNNPIGCDPESAFWGGQIDHYVSLWKAKFGEDVSSSFYPQYFNAGLIVCNLLYRRDTDFCGAFDAICKNYKSCRVEYKDVYQYADQDFLNAEFAGEILSIPTVWNCMPDFDKNNNPDMQKARQRAAKVLHMYGPFKRGGTGGAEEFVVRESYDEYKRIYEIEVLGHDRN